MNRFFGKAKFLLGQMKETAVILLLFLLVQVVCAGAAQLFGGATATPSAPGTPALPFSPTAYAVALFFGEMVLVVLLGLFRLIRRRPVTALRWTRHHTVAVAGMLLLGLGLSVLDSLIGLPDNGMNDLFGTMLRNPLCLLLLCVVGPLTEELVFREGILRSLVQRGISPVTAVAVSALLFGLVHGNAAQALPAVALGFALGLFYLRTRDILLCGVAHMTNNTIAVLLLMRPEAEAAVTGLDVQIQIAVCVLLSLTGVALLANWWCRSAQPHHI